MANFYKFSFFNVVSFSFLAGNLIILYALRFSAGNILIGVIAASYQFTFIFSLIGRTLVRRLGAVKLFGYFWAVRYIVMVPLLLTAIPRIRDNSALARGPVPGS